MESFINGPNVAAIFGSEINGNNGDLSNAAIDIVSFANGAKFAAAVVADGGGGGGGTDVGVDVVRAAFDNRFNR